MINIQFLQKSKANNREKFALGRRISGEENEQESEEEEEMQLAPTTPREKSRVDDNSPDKKTVRTSTSDGEYEETAEASRNTEQQAQNDDSAVNEGQVCI